MQSAMYSAVSGLSANSNAMSVIGNNISNSNTTGFKADRALFSDILAQEISAAGGRAQIGRGVNTATVDTDFSQGTFQGTGSNTDLAVDGPGMFIMGEPETDETLYTRDGAFEFSSDGFLVNSTGQRVQGYELDENNDTVGDLTDVQVDTEDSIPAQQTGTVDLSTNLNADAPVIDDGFDLENPNETSNFVSSVNVYDSLGEEHTLTTYFTKTDDENNEWVFNTTLSEEEVDDDQEWVEDPVNGVGTIMHGDISFNENGEVDEIEDNTTNQLSWANGAAQDQEITFDFDLTQFSGQSEVVRQEQDGYASGHLVDVNIDQEGNVITNYSNGMSENEYRLAMAQFPNENGLHREGDNLYSATAESGQPGIGMPGTSVGTIRSNSLEESNVDIAEQFTDMITTQRAYQANSRTISTTSDLLQEVINLTR